VAGDASKEGRVSAGGLVVLVAIAVLFYLLMTRLRPDTPTLFVRAPRRATWGRLLDPRDSTGQSDGRGATRTIVFTAALIAYATVWGLRYVGVGAGPRMLSTGIAVIAVLAVTLALQRWRR
jgi:hypothetical protein